MKRQTLIALGIALILGLVAVIVANAYLSGRERQLENSPQGMVRVAVAAMPLDFGTQLTPEKVKFVNYPATSLPPGTYRTLQELLPAGKTRAALRPIQINQPLLASDLTGEGEGASIAALLPDGMRAATIRINDVSGVAGFVNPNDVVDVLITRQSPGGAQQNVTDVLLQNVRVLAKGQSTKDAGQPDQASVDRSVTVEVSPIDAQKLVLGQQLGSLSLVLRKPGMEQNIPQVKPITLEDLRYSYQTSLPPQGGAAPATAAGAPPPAEQRARIAAISQPRRPTPRPVRAAPAPTKSTNTVVVTRGTEASSYEVGDYARQ
ncbi:Flp pilus assembly protein CpaB [Sphingomonas jaspsi]|uniref:Flp pilus assembly protein CpaB n=1 Tax=Sphingomonas jaspsi TaxID=392409 RepID=UPI0004B6B12C|nr:Flp pilus assembly protein CpaB [Sphingomonas jaspsi]